MNLAGLFEFGGALANLGSGFAAKHGISGSFFTGVLATLVATPCTAPFMGSAIAYALLQPTVMALAVFAALGLGLAFPYVLICTVPFIRVHLPKPGVWMQTFRQFLAFPMFASAVWLVWVYVEQIGSDGIVTALGGMVALAFVIWLVEHRKKTLWLVPLVVIALGYWGWTSGRVSSTAFVDPYTQARLEELLKTTDNPVFVNMTAAWCITCKINEKVALATPETEKLFANLSVQYLKGDWTNRDKVISDYLESFHRDGVPLYVYYPPKDAATGERPEPIVLPQILTAGIIKDALTKDQK
jgi:thiol:disulfide interchange protein DsbD